MYSSTSRSRACQVDVVWIGRGCGADGSGIRACDRVSRGRRAGGEACLRQQTSPKPGMVSPSRSPHHVHDGKGLSLVPPPFMQTGSQQQFPDSLCRLASSCLGSGGRALGFGGDGAGLGGRTRPARSPHGAWLRLCPWLGGVRGVGCQPETSGRLTSFWGGSSEPIRHCGRVPRGMA